MERVSHDPETDAEPVPGVELAQLAAGSEMSVQHFTIAPGATVPEHSHPHEQVGYITRGTITFVLADGSEVVCESGDSYAIAGGETHAAENRGEEPIEGIDVFAPPRTNPDWGE